MREAVLKEFRVDVHEAASRGSSEFLFVMMGRASVRGKYVPETLSLHHKAEGT